MPSPISKIVAWLKAGYPEGVPDADYVPLLAVLARRLSGDEVAMITHEIRRMNRPPADDADIGVLITKFTDEMPRDEDIRRVRARLAGAGWPLS